MCYISLSFSVLTSFPGAQGSFSLMDCYDSPMPWPFLVCLSPTWLSGLTMDLSSCLGCHCHCPAERGDKLFCPGIVAVHELQPTLLAFSPVPSLYSSCVPAPLSCLFTVHWMALCPGRIAVSQMPSFLSVSPLPFHVCQILHRWAVTLSPSVSCVTICTFHISFIVAVNGKIYREFLGRNV